MNPFTERAISIISTIPEGKVMTYGQIAKLSGSARGARQIVRILHAMSHTYNLPWHRVVNAQGKVAIQDEQARFEQILFLSGEGVKIDENGQINLEQYLFQP